MLSKEIKERRKRIELAPVIENYDIISYGNNENDIRCIEVKTHKRLLNANFIELSKYEYDFGKER